jgi:EAL domain-containing protein (putative c-di-GMP-specific phosphodiesterase class I)
MEGTNLSEAVPPIGSPAVAVVDEGGERNGLALSGWPDVRRLTVDGVAALLAQQSATIVLIDARSDADAHDHVIALAPTGAPLLVIAAADAAPAFLAAGATHFLATPTDDARIADALGFAARWFDRGGERRLVDLPADAARVVEECGANHVMLVALSRLDIVNAAYGRRGGDAVLEVAERRIRNVAAGCFDGARVLRTGGATFLIAAAADPAGAARAAALMDAALARPLPLGEIAAVIGARFAVAEREEGEDAGALLRRAINALSAVQASDGATMRLARPEGAAPIATLAVDLHRAIERGEIAVLFQPQVRLSDGAITGVEALARWDHPQLGSLGADTLFAAADRADLGLALSDQIQTIALAGAAAWPATLAGVSLSLNVTAADVGRTGFAETLLERVGNSGFAPGRLTVEITETALIADLDAAAVALASLQAHGIRIAIDDFGTGYASFAYLKALPLDTLKIDRSLARGVVGSDRDRAIVRGIVAMADALGLSVIAEGVETETERDLLAAEGCDAYQGFLCAGPLDAAALADHIARWRGATA